MTLLSAPVETVPTGRLRLSGLARLARRYPLVLLGGGLLAILVILAFTAPFFAGDPVNMDPFKRLQQPSAELWFGSDNLGRDVFARTIFGARISLLVGLLSAALAAMAGLLIGVIAGYSRSFDNVVMRVMDGLMSIPTILLAIALISLTGPGIGILIAVVRVIVIAG
jgi:peptide/nickel transport system permease protein